MTTEESFKNQCWSLYLPYNLRVDMSEIEHKDVNQLLISVNVHSKRIITKSDHGSEWLIDPEFVKPILRPLSDFVDNLDKWSFIRDEFSELSFEHFINSFFLLGGSLNRLSSLDMEQYKLLMKNHF